MERLNIIKLDKSISGGDGYVTKIIRRAMKADRIVGEVISENVMGTISYKAEVRDGLVVDDFGYRFSTIDEALEKIEEWYQEERDLIRAMSAYPKDYMEILRELKVSDDDFIHYANVRLEVMSISEKRKRISSLEIDLARIESGINDLHEKKDEVSMFTVKTNEVLISNIKSEIVRLNRDIQNSIEEVDQILS